MDMLLQLAILVLTIGIFWAMHGIPKQAHCKLRNRGRSNVQLNRHLVRGAHLLARARSTKSPTISLALARDATNEADKALSLSPKDSSSHMLKALALDLLGRKSSALRSLDAALSPPAAKSLTDMERSAALFKRAELQIAVNRRRRVDLAVLDLVEAVRLSPVDAKLWCLLGSCYEQKGMRKEARRAYEEARKVDPGSVIAREGLSRLAS